MTSRSDAVRIIALEERVSALEEQLNAQGAIIGELRAQLAAPAPPPVEEKKPKAHAA